LGGCCWNSFPQKTAVATQLLSADSSSADRAVYIVLLIGCALLHLAMVHNGIHVHIIRIGQQVIGEKQRCAEMCMITQLLVKEFSLSAIRVPPKKENHIASTHQQKCPGISGDTSKVEFKICPDTLIYAYLYRMLYAVSWWEPGLS